MGSFEVRSQSSALVEDRGDGDAAISQTIEVVLFTPGEYATPELLVTVRDPSGEVTDIPAPMASVTVVSILGEDDLQLRDIRPQAALSNPPLWPWIALALVMPAGVAARASSLLSTDQAAAVALAAWAIAVGLAGALLMKPRAQVRRWLRFGIAAAVVLLAAAALQMSTHLLVDDGNDIVVVADLVDVMSGPDAQYVAESALSAGAEAELLERRGAWTRITLPGAGFQGWVPADAVETVDPDSPL